MPDPAARLRDAVEGATPRLLAISEENACTLPGPGKWSAKQVIGHLIDSASNNHGRFVRAQFTDEFVFPGYDGEKWVEVQRYSDSKWNDLVSLWRLFNLHIAHVMENTPSDSREWPRTTHNLDEIAFAKVGKYEAFTLEQYMNDYVDHLVHHLAQIE
jgi:hypothetical protein